MVTPYFSSIRKTLINAFSRAAKTIDIAVAWFTNEQIFDAIVSRLEEGVKVRLVLVNDDINHGGGLDFQRFVDKGGELYFGRTGYLMHNKYCIIDGETVYTGSYNYTYYAEHSNFENIVCISDDGYTASEYVKNYEYILSVSDSVPSVGKYLQEHPFAVNSQATLPMRNRDLYQKANELYEQKDIVRAEEIMASITPPLENQDSFIIKDVLYQQWQPGYTIRSIKVANSEVIFSIDVPIVRRPGCFSYIFLHGGGMDKTWHLETPGAIIYADSIRNVRIDGTLILPKIDKNTTYRFVDMGHDPLSPVSDWGKALDGSSTNRYTLPMMPTSKRVSCDLVFPKGDYINGIVNLFEGNKFDQSRYEFWHFLRVNMLLNREPV